MEYMSKINKILNSKNVRKQFNQLPIEIKMVEIDKLILPQNSVNMHDVEDMIKKFPKKLDMDALIHICFEAGILSCQLPRYLRLIMHYIVRIV